MSFLHLAFLYCGLSIFLPVPSLDYQQYSHAKRLASIATGDSKQHDVAPGTTNIIFQSKDDGKTWENISFGLPENIKPVEFFAEESEIYLRVENGMFRSNSKLKSPVWEKEDGSDSPTASIAFNRSGIVESNGVLIATGQRGIRRSTDNGEHWDWVIREGGVGIAVEKIEGGIAAISCNTTTMTRRIHISMNEGKTWEAIGDGLRPSLFITSIKQVGKYLICGHPDGIFRSSDMGKTWNIVHPSVENRDVKYRTTLNSDPLEDHRKVFRIYVSGHTVYAVAGSAGC